jgi:hypothetical protein
MRFVRHAHARECSRVPVDGLLLLVAAAPRRTGSSRACTSPSWEATYRPHLVIRGLGGQRRWPRVTRGEFLPRPNRVNNV